MMKWNRTTLCLLAGLLMMPWIGHADSAGEVVSVIGTPQVRSGEGAWIPLRLNDSVGVGDRIRTGAGKVKLLLVDDTVLTLDTNTDLRLSAHMFKPKEERRSGLFDLFSGRIKTLVGHFLGQSDVRVQTPTAVAGVRGTYFLVEYSPAADGSGGDTRVTVFDGEVDLSSGELSMSLTHAMTGGIGAAGLLGQPHQLSEQELRGLEQGLDVRSKSAAKDRARQMVAKFAADAGEFASKAGGAGSSLSGFSANLGEVSEQLKEQQTGNGVPPIDLESFEPSRGRRTVRVLWPKGE